MKLTNEESIRLYHDIEKVVVDNYGISEVGLSDSVLDAVESFLSTTTYGEGGPS